MKMDILCLVLLFVSLFLALTDVQRSQTMRNPMCRIRIFRQVRKQEVDGDKNRYVCR